MPILEGCVFFTQKNQGFQAFKFPRQKLLLSFSCRLFGYPRDVQQNTTLILNLAVKTPTNIKEFTKTTPTKTDFHFLNQVALEITTTNTKKIISTQSKPRWKHLDWAPCLHLFFLQRRKRRHRGETPSNPCDLGSKSPKETREKWSSKTFSGEKCVSTLRNTLASFELKTMFHLCEVFGK